MSIPVVCEHCGGSYRLNHRYAGQRVKCPSCKGPIAVPSGYEAAAAVPGTSQDESISTEGAAGQPAAPATAGKATVGRTVPLDCTRCWRRYRIPAHLARSAIKCRQCGELLVPAGASPARLSPPAPAAVAATDGVPPLAAIVPDVAGALAARPPAASVSPTRRRNDAFSHPTAAPAPAAALPVDLADLPLAELADDVPLAPPLKLASAVGHPRSAARSKATLAKSPGRKGGRRRHSTSNGVAPLIFGVGGLAAGVLFLVALIVSWLVPDARLAVGGLFYGIGILVAFVTGIWLLVLAFREDVVCGLLYLFLPFYSLYYLITRWSETKVPFLIGLGGMVLSFFGIFLIIVATQSQPGSAGGGPWEGSPQPVGRPAGPQ